MTLYFCRSFPFQIELSQKARFFILKIRVPGTVDPESGMSISLVEMNDKVKNILPNLQGISGEPELLTRISQHLASFATRANLVLEEPASLRAWGLENKAPWLEKKLWVTLRGEKKMLLLSIRSKQEIANNRSEYQSLADLRRQLESFGDRMISWNVLDPVTGIARGY